MKEGRIETLVLGVCTEIHIHREVRMYNVDSVHL